MQLISLETARLAKEKGFIIEPLHKYSLVYGYTYNIYNEDGNLIRKNFILQNECVAVSQSELYKWLRDLFNIIIIVTTENMPPCNWLVQVLFMNDKSDHDKKSSGLYGDNGEFCTYEEAFEFGLQIALKRI